VCCDGFFCFYTKANFVRAQNIERKYYMYMTSKEILEKYIKFYTDKDHKLIPNMSLIPEGDSTLLFVNSGMFPLVPYLSGQLHPLGKRLVNVQRAGRFQEDLDEVGDSRHTTAFHMIGNWSLGDYFKKEQLPWIYEFLVDVVKLDPRRLFATVFEGDQYAPKDTISVDIIKGIFKKHGIDAEVGQRIYECGRDKNWWQRGDAVGELGGPDSEIYYYLGEGSGEGKNPSEYENEYLEIGNSVFMQYKRTVDGGWEELAQTNVDFGGGLERIAMVVQKKHDIFETDMFWPIVEKIQKLSGKKYTESAEVTRSMRILADHMRGSVFMAMDGVAPGNKDREYILRRLLRRIVRTGMSLGVMQDISSNLVGVVCTTCSWLYPELPSMEANIKEVFAAEEDKFRTTLEAAVKEMQKFLSSAYEPTTPILARNAFDLYQSLGLPIEIFLDELKDHNIEVDANEFNQIYNELYIQHKNESRSGAEQKFKGGLADHSEQVVKYHTTTHLLQAALREVLGDQIIQKGSNITGERLRFDFAFDKKLAEEQVDKVEAIVNSKIKAALPVNFVDLPKEEAEKEGAVHAFGEKYGEIVRIYFIGDSIGSAYSKEFCGEPHVANTSEISEIHIYKQESIGKGLQRIYAK
jgi:alanyl-tRNA synthetase